MASTLTKQSKNKAGRTAVAPVVTPAKLVKTLGALQETRFTYVPSFGTADEPKAFRVPQDMPAALAKQAADYEKRRAQFCCDEHMKTADIVEAVLTDAIAKARGDGALPSEAARKEARAYTKLAMGFLRCSRDYKVKGAKRRQT